MGGGAKVAVDVDTQVTDNTDWLNWFNTYWYFNVLSFLRTFKASGLVGKTSGQFYTVLPWVIG